MHVPSSPRRPITVLLTALLSLVLAGSTSLAQDDPPKQTGLSEIGDPIEFREDPAFAFAVPKKKRQFKKIVERWRVVDLELRKENALTEIGKAIEQAEAADPQDEQRLLELRSQKAQIEGFYHRTKVLLEVDGDPKEWMRIEVNRLDERSGSISKYNPRENLERRWSKVKIVEDKETTSKAEKKKGRQSHRLMLFGTPENSQDHGFWRIETHLVPSKDGQALHRLMAIHQMPASRFDKKTAQEMELIARCLVIP